ncbi:hypothetical protein TNCV_1203791 [Trichonephila clavipes]|nr:hypothetical protein TNCV_1203791 [Trichonephila clavipes]
MERSYLFFSGSLVARTYDVSNEEKISIPLISPLRSFRLTQAFRGEITGAKKECFCEHLELTVQDLWAFLPQNSIRSLINSMPNRVATCIAAGGGPTRY